MFIYAYLSYVTGCSISRFIDTMIYLLFIYYRHLVILNIGFYEQCCSEPLCTCALV